MRTPTQELAELLLTVGLCEIPAVLVILRIEWFRDRVEGLRDRISRVQR